MGKNVLNSYKKGIKDGLPIGLGYLSVSFTFGMMAVSMGLPGWVALLISATNLTSAGQFAGLSLIVGGAPLFEMALTQFVINLRYALMSISISQRLSEKVTIVERIVFSFFNTDEVFAVASSQNSDLGKRYLYGLVTIPYLGWTVGTLLGASVSGVLPPMIRDALGIAIYGMFIAIIIPPAKHNKPVALVIIASVILSSVFKFTPILSQISTGFVIIICAVSVSILGAILFPIHTEDEESV